MDISLGAFRLAKFQFVLKAVDGIDLPVYKGSTLRGGQVFITALPEEVQP